MRQSNERKCLQTVYLARDYYPKLGKSIAIDLKGDIQMPNRHKKKCSTSLIIVEMQTQTPMQYCLTPIRMVITQRTKQKKPVRTQQSHYGKQHVNSLKIENRTIISSRTPASLCILIRESKTICQRSIFTPVFIAVFSTISKTQN